MSDSIFNEPLKDGGSVSGVRGGTTKFHDYNNLGVGHIKDQKTGERLANVNNFTETVDSMLPPAMRIKKG